MTAPDEKARKIAREAQSITSGWMVNDNLVRLITAALIEARRAALEEAAKVAWATSPGTAAEATAAIINLIAAEMSALIPIRPDGASERSSLVP